MVEVAILRQDDVLKVTGLKNRITLWKMWKAGEFPAPVKLGARSIGWRREAVQQWLDGLQEIRTANHS